MNRFMNNMLYPDAPFHTLPTNPDYTRIAQSIVALFQALSGHLTNAPVKGNPLSNVVFVDGGTTLPTSMQNGSIQTPFKTFTQAMASPQLATNGAIIATSGDYTTDGTIICPVGVTLTINAVSSIQQTAYEAPYPVPTPQVKLWAFVFSGADTATSNLIATGVNIPNTLIKPDNGVIQLKDCIVGVVGAPLSFLYMDNSTLLTSADVRSVNATNSTFYQGDGGATIDLDETVPSYLLGCVGRTGMAWLNPSGTVYVDPWSYDVVNTFVNGSAVIRGMPIQTLVGTTVQEQLNSIASALVNLHLAIDNRTP